MKTVPMISIMMLVAILFSVTAIAAADTTNIGIGEVKAKACESCHGHNGIGSSMAPQIAGIPAEQILAGLQRPPMTSVVEQFSQQEKEAVAAYFSLLRTEGGKVVSLNNQTKDTN